MNVHFLRGRSHRQGYTLIELMVVITIIAILAAVSIPAFGIVQKMMAKTRAKTLCVSIATAINQYNAEYMVYPDAVTGVTAFGDDKGLAADNTAGWVAMCSTLNGNKNLYTADDVTPVTANTRNIPYLSVNRRDLHTTGYIKDPLNSAGNTSFELRMDCNYDNILTDIPNLTSAGGDSKISNPVAVWSTANGTNQKDWVGSY